MTVRYYASFWRTIRYAHVCIPTVQKENYTTLGTPEILLVLDKADRAPREPWWRIPGGSIEDGETPAAAMNREFYEETGCRVPKTEVVLQNNGGQLANKTRALLVVGVGPQKILLPEDFKTSEVFAVRYFPIDALPFTGKEPGSENCRLDRFTYELFVACIRRNWRLLEYQGIVSSFNSVL